MGEKLSAPIALRWAINPFSKGSLAMIPCRTIEVRAPVRTLSVVLVLLTGLGLGAPASAAAPDETLLQPTPLILKDGRIANVAVYVVRFPPGGARLDPAMTNQLNALTHQVATDCFLTAQVIGHVDLSEVAGNDTLNAHRLARSRADAVQASLIDGGLPAKAIASVWDWQFMVREARATLWVFRLTPGEDCEGTPLRPGASDLVAQAEPETPPAAAEPSTKAVPSAFVEPGRGRRRSAPAEPGADRAGNRQRPTGAGFDHGRCSAGRSSCAGDRGAARPAVLASAKPGQAESRG